MIFNDLCNPLELYIHSVKYIKELSVILVFPLKFSVKFLKNEISGNTFANSIKPKSVTLLLLEKLKSMLDRELYKFYELDTISENSCKCLSDMLLLLAKLNEIFVSLYKLLKEKSKDEIAYEENDLFFSKFNARVYRQSLTPLLLKEVNKFYKAYKV